MRKGRASRANSCLLLVLTDKARAAAAKGSFLGLATGEAAPPTPPTVRPEQPAAIQEEAAPAPPPEVQAEAAAPEPSEPEAREPEPLELEAHQPEPVPVDVLDRMEIEMRWDAIKTIPARTPPSSREDAFSPGWVPPETSAVDESGWERL